MSYVEDDYVWNDDQTGYTCLIIRHAIMGFYCGYVRVKGILEGVDYYHHLLNDIDVHGGLTYSGKIHRHDGYWLGFDCGHGGDYIPYSGRPIEDYEIAPIFREKSYVKEQCEKLAKQIFDIESAVPIPEGN